MLKKNDNVIVIAGKDKGKTGVITQVLTKTGKVTVKDVNVATRHTKPTQKNPQGGTVRKELPIDASNVMMLDPKTNKPTRLGKKQVNGKWVRVAKKSGTVLN
ncbi:MAG: 50S ribosomal protein L24 [Bdellovibrionales bacterium]|nr:50S ribosomal protein L24 [Bdellovibrionales bacterium]